MQEISSKPDYSTLTDAELVDQVLSGFRDAFRQLMQRGNQRLFRMARGVLDSNEEAEDVVQESWLRVYSKLDTFRGESSVLTWMTRIVLNEAYRRLRERRPTTDVEQLDIAPTGSARVIPFPGKFGIENPAATASRAQIRHLLEQAVADLPEPFRLVFILREIEECTTEETAQSLGIRAETVKTRLHRARRLLRSALQDTVRTTLSDAFPFLGLRCARMTDNVMNALATKTFAARIEDDVPPH
ncbi:MAG TPA: RNA polymerase sigma factor [Dokdonella sp.]|uniref:RNA polymerase sigma factor n=1 Tax=Dokdonella sp. TaxID=2291710 RepID=UPI002D7FF72E|nr:RNA polymerase sigma factor [Dokdonella sp.]HET9032899.1 RNA polymerase sigma factor [Dokdonella sp.]